MKKYWKKILLSAVIGSLLTFLYWYVVLPPLNLQSPEFWISLALVIAFYSIPFVLKKKEVPVMENNRKVYKEMLVPTFPKALIITLIVPVAVLLLGGIISSTFFNAKAYANVITVTEADFEKDMPETNEVTNIALMDSESASIIGNRTLGQLSDVVSQYVISGSYTQINYQGKPKKVANLEYDGFFKWLNRSSSGVPGYVIVDPVNNTADYVKLEKPLKYVPSGFFGDSLERKLRSEYPTKIFGGASFEIDENGNPYYIVSCLRPQVMLFGAEDVEEVIIFNPCDGSSEICKVEDAPSWIDIVYSGYLMEDKYNWHGTLSGGYFNSIIGNENCKMTTDDFGYIALGDDVWYFTGVTSVTSDESNIGFILSNARTGEYKYYQVNGAEEYSAMSAAQGEVQEKGYVASFPSLINVSGEATYIMVLKDSGGLVKLYALVNVKNYGLVATGDTQAAAMKNYKRLLNENGVTDTNTETLPSVEITCEDVRIATVSGTSYLYITGSDGNLYKGNIQDDETLMLIKSGDKLTVKYTDGDHEKIKNIASWEYKSE